MPLPEQLTDEELEIAIVSDGHGQVITQWSLRQLADRASKKACDKLIADVQRVTSEYETKDRDGQTFRYIGEIRFGHRLLKEWGVEK
jgi:hypothetical protein